MPDSVGLPQCNFPGTTGTVVMGIDPGNNPIPLGVLAPGPNGVVRTMGSGNLVSHLLRRCVHRERGF
jgi:hypothetical protein